MYVMNCLTLNEWMDDGMNELLDRNVEWYEIKKSKNVVKNILNLTWRKI